VADDPQHPALPLLHGALLGGLHLGLALTWVGRELSLGSACFVFLLGALAVPTRVTTHLTPGLAGLASCGLGALGFVALCLQMDYAQGVLGGGGLVVSGVDALGQGAAALERYSLEVLAVLAAVAPPLGLAEWARRKRLGLGTQAAIVLVGASAVLWSTLTWAGFVGLPQPGWLLRAAWFHPLLGTYLMAQPVVGAALLPAVRRLAERLLPPRAERRG
jgi:hypothetical protein